MFSELPEAGPDPILGSARLFADDPSPDKVDMGIGVYKDDAGRAPVLDSVKAAEAQLLERQESKTYLSPAGNPAYNAQIRELIFGDDPGMRAAGEIRAVTVQAPGGTGALRVAADFLRAHAPDATVWIPAPSWPNHRNIFGTAGFALGEYPCYDAAAGRLTLAPMLEALSAAQPGDVVILHACCHNPSGADPDPQGWSEIAALLEARGLLPVVDLAYLGFGDGIAADLAGLRILTTAVPELIVASSCSKNFALYRERVGSLSFVAGTPALAGRAAGLALGAARANYSMPPDHGAAVVAEILGDGALRQGWLGELEAMRTRLHGMRRQFAAGLTAASGRDFGHIAGQRGMFALIPMPRGAVAALRERHHIHASASGRLNLAGLTSRNVARVAAAVGAELAALEETADA